MNQYFESSPDGGSVHLRDIITRIHEIVIRGLMRLIRNFTGKWFEDLMGLAVTQRPASSWEMSAPVHNQRQGRISSEGRNETRAHWLDSSPKRLRHQGCEPPRYTPQKTESDYHKSVAKPHISSVKKPQQLHPIHTQKLGYEALASAFKTSTCTAITV